MPHAPFASLCRLATPLAAMVITVASGCDRSNESSAPSPQADRRPANIDPATLPIPTEPALAAGYDVWINNCVICHTEGTDGAPRITDTKAWQPRHDKGRAELYDSAITGFDDMPPRGDSPELTDDQLKSAVDYMLFATFGVIE